MPTASVDEKLALCQGCRDDFYNDHNSIGVKQCWLLKDATEVTRYKLAWWTAPTVPGAFAEVRALACWRAPGKFAMYTTLPDFAVDVVRAK